MSAQGATQISKAKLDVGIVGLGKMGILHAGIVNSLSNGRVKAICEKEGMIVKAAKKILPNIPFYESVEEMLSQETLDAVFITTPIQTHVSIVKTILDSNENVGLFVEKPLAANGDDAREIAQLASDKDIINIVGLQKRFSPVFQRAKLLLESGSIGDLQFFKGYNYVSDIFREGEGWRFRKGSGGALLDLGPHILDLLLWYLGELRPLSAVQRSFYSSEVEDYVHVVLETPSGVLGTVDVSWSIRGYRLPEIIIEIHGTNGAMVVTDDYVRIQTDAQAKGAVAREAQTIQKTSLDSSVEFLLADPEFTIEDKYFLESVGSKKAAQPDFRTAANLNQMIDLLHQMAEKGS